MDFVGGGYNDHFAEIEIDNKRHIDEVRNGLIELKNKISQQKIYNIP